jgi:hypothetical protein
LIHPGFLNVYRLPWQAVWQLKVGFVRNDLFMGLPKPTAMIYFCQNDKKPGTKNSRVSGLINFKSEKKI